MSDRGLDALKEIETRHGDKARRFPGSRRGQAFRKELGEATERLGQELKAKLAEIRASLPSAAKALELARDVGIRSAEGSVDDIMKRIR